MAGGWPSWPLRSAAMIAVAFSVMERRRARLSAALICVRVSFAARAGSGALASSSSASGAARFSKAASAAGKYSRSWCRSCRPSRQRPARTHRGQGSDHAGPG
jgi:hypothetical protein